MRRWSTIIAIAAMLITAALNPPALKAGPGHGEAHKGHEAPTPGATPEGKSVDIELLDLTLVDQDGRKVRFKSDVIGDRLAIITNAGGPGVKSSETVWAGRSFWFPSASIRVPIFRRG